MPRARSLWAALVSCAAILFCDSIAVARDDPPDTRSCVELTADWPLWSALSQYPWSQAEIDRKIFFSLGRLKAALRAVPLTAPVRLMGNETEDYARGVPDRAGKQAYAAAAELYRADDFRKAIPLFDKIVADSNSGYRAAAAYTAARAMLLSGDLEGTGVRIDAMVRDPSLQEFAAPAYDLFSKIRYQSNAAPLNAAEMSQISFMLTAPTEVVCSSPVGEQLRRKFDEEFLGLVYIPSEYNRWNRFSSRVIASTALAKVDPIIDIAAALGSLPSFTFYPSGGGRGWAQQRPSAIASHVRRQWDATHNPLWAVALAEHTTDEADLGRLGDSLAVLRTWPGLSASAQSHYAWRIVAQIVRLNLVAGKFQEAVAAGALLTPADITGSHVQPQPDIVKAERVILVDGIDWFVGQGDFETARKWALAVVKQFGIPVPDKLKPLLVRDLDELYGNPVFGLHKSGDAVELGNVRVIFDIYSSHQLIEISRRLDISPGDRRAFVAAAWSRAYALERWDDVVGWLPDLTHAFPELSGDAGEIGHAWFRGTMRHAALLLMLKTPGLDILPSRGRPPGGAEYLHAVEGGVVEPDIRQFDYDNPSDGNWWCALDDVEIRRSIGAAFVDMATEDDWFAEEMGFTRTDQQVDRAERNLTIYPLLKTADTSELSLLANAGSASKRLAEASVKWASGVKWFDRLLRQDRDVPEALARSVAATRYGCRRPPENGPWSRAAYETLHKNYPNSDWAKQTKYWFNTIQQGG